MQCQACCVTGGELPSCVHQVGTSTHPANGTAMTVVDEAVLITDLYGKGEISVCEELAER